MSDVGSHCAFQLLDFRLGQSVLESEEWFSYASGAPTVAERGKVQLKARLPLFKFNWHRSAHLGRHSTGNR